MKNKYPKATGLLVIFAIYIIAYVIGGFIVYLLRDTLTSTDWRLLIFSFVSTLIIWLGSSILKNTSVYDPYWSLTPMVMMIYVVAINKEVINAYHIVLFIVFLLWSLRLTINWAYTFKNLETEDYRYAKYRKEYNPFKFQLINLFGFMILPTMLGYLGLLPLIYLFSKTASAWSLIGSIIVLIGFLLELFADISGHKHLKENEDVVNNKILWKYSRHPKYLGEIFVWLGSYLSLLVSVPKLWYLGLGALLIVGLVEFILIPTSEEWLLKTVPNYEKYRQATSRLLPLPKAIKIKAKTNKRTN